MAKERVAQLSDATVGVHRLIGRDEYGGDVVEKVPSRTSEMFLDPAGNEVYVPLNNGRVDDPESMRQYGMQHRRDMIAQGFIPVRDCPYTAKYEELAKGPLVAPPKGEKACAGAVRTSVAFNTPEAHEISAKQIYSREPVMWQPCKHYFAHREKLRARAREDAIVRKSVLSQDGPTEQMKRMADAWVQVAHGGAGVGDLRANLSAGKKGK